MYRAHPTQFNYRVQLTFVNFGTLLSNHNISNVKPVLRFACFSSTLVEMDVTKKDSSLTNLVLTRGDVKKPRWRQF